MREFNRVPDTRLMIDVENYVYLVHEVYIPQIVLSFSNSAMIYQRFCSFMARSISRFALLRAASSRLS